MAKRTIGKIYIFKVALEGRKRIWRRIAVRSNQTLDDLHEAIYEAFDRDDEHLYSFYFSNAVGRGRAWLTDAVEYTHPYNCEQGGFFGDEKMNNAAKTRIGTLKLKPGRKFKYLFDFGDSWWHEITVEQTDGNADEGKYPRIIERKGKSPPQYVYEDEE